MKLLLPSLLLCLLLAACSRQPVRVNTPLPSPTAPASAVITPNAEPENEAMQPMEGEMSAPQEADEGVMEPSKNDPVRAPRPNIPNTKESDNTTANIENQGNLGQAPIGADETESALRRAPIMTYKKSACYGDCDVYTLEVLPDDLMLLNVSNGSRASGAYERELDPFKARELMGALDSLRSEDFLDMYPSEGNPPADVQFTQIVIPDMDDNLRSITVYYGAPPALKQFMNRIDELVANEIWKPLR